MYKDKIYAKLQDNNVRNRILAEELDRSECDNQNVYNFLTLLKRLNNLLSTIIIQLINEEEWEAVVRASKKQSALSIFSFCTYTVYKCAL